MIVERITRLDLAARGVVLPEGWYIERTERNDGYGTRKIDFAVFEEGGAVWKTTGDPRSAITVEVWIDHEGRERYGPVLGPRVSWPSTSDRRPALARALAAALVLAANEAERASS